MNLRARIGVVFLAVTLASCGSRTCVPGVTQLCNGAGGCQGGQSCNASGTGFSDCVCMGSKADGGNSSTPSCAVGNGGCDDNADCFNTGVGLTCTCRTGYAGTGVTCTDINECLKDNGGCDPLTTCTNSAGSSSCGACPPGYTGSGSTGCVDVNECLSANGGCNEDAECTNVAGGRICDCLPGYSGTGLTCSDVNECLTDNGGCDFNATCSNNPGGRTCSCNSGYVGTGLSCSPVSSCGPTTCPTGCCIQNACYAGTAIDSCGTSGSVCVACTPGKVCSQHACVVVVVVVDAGTPAVDGGMAPGDAGMSGDASVPGDAGFPGDASVPGDAGFPGDASVPFDAGQPGDASVPGDAGSPGDAGTPGGDGGIVLCSPAVVISQLYGAGGNTGALYNADFIELHNRTGTTVSLSGWSLQYASGTSSVNPWFAIELQGSIAPHGFFLIQAGSVGANGSATPTPFTISVDGGVILMSASNGKIALLSGLTPLVGACPTSAELVDWVGYGNANCAEGGDAGATTPQLSATLAAFRLLTVGASQACVDTNFNAADFSVASPAPRTSASPTSQCECTQ